MVPILTWDKKFDETLACPSLFSKRHHAPDVELIDKVNKRQSRAYSVSTRPGVGSGAVLVVTVAAVSPGGRKVYQRIYTENME